MHATADFEIEPLSVFFDGDCPLCTREIQMIERRDRHRRIRFVDIAARDFQAKTLGVDREDLMAEIHAVLPDGTVIKGVEVFRQMYERIGFAGLTRVSRWWGVRHSLQAGYSLWAKNRLRLTGRCNGDTCPGV